MLYIDRIFSSANGSNFEKQRWEKNLAICSYILIDRISPTRVSLNSIYLYFFKYSEKRYVRKNCKYAYIHNNKVFFFFDNNYLTRGMYSSIASKSFNLLSHGPFYSYRSFNYNMYI